MRHQPKYSEGSTNGLRTSQKSPYRRVPIARGPVVGLTCCDCGWPFKVTSSVMFAGRDEEGEKKFSHARCPSLSERKALRAEALLNA